MRQQRAVYASVLGSALLLYGVASAADDTAAPEEGTINRVDSATAKKVIVIAHRGAHTDVPENTLEALERAIEIGCDYVEVDVRKTKDGALVIMHDGTVNRMTNGKGRVDDLTLDEIRQLEVRSRRAPAGKIYRVPTFDEILARAKKGGMKIYVDHKVAPPAMVLAAIRKHDMLKDVVVYGSVPVLSEYKQLAPEVWIMPDHPANLAQLADLARELKPETLDGSIVRWKPAQVQAAHRLKIQVWVDNVPPLDNEAGIQKALDLGVDAIQTDNPRVVLDALKKFGRRPK